MARWMRGCLEITLAAVLFLACTGGRTEGVGGSTGDDGVDGPACMVNADCATSAAAAEAAEAKCPVAEYFCLNGRCEAACASTCEPERGATACGQGVCTPYIPSLWYCHMRSIECESSTDCPAEPPAGSSGSEDDWSCDDGVCRYPDVVYPTE